MRPEIEAILQQLLAGSESTRASCRQGLLRNICTTEPGSVDILGHSARLNLAVVS